MFDGETGDNLNLLKDKKTANYNTAILFGY